MIRNPELAELLVDAPRLDDVVERRLRLHLHLDRVTDRTLKEIQAAITGYAHLPAEEPGPRG